MKAQGTNPVIKRLKELLEEFKTEAPYNVQLNSEMAEVKYLCSHWNCLEIVRGVVTRVTGDLTGRKIYSHLVPINMRIEQDTGRFGYAKMFPLFAKKLALQCYMMPIFRAC